MRAHLPLLLALSANSPFWQGRDTGLASARTPLFQAFPRVGIPRAFADYAEYVEAIDLLIRCEALPEPTFLWWDVRLQPRFGTVEIRIMDAQTRLADTAGIVGLIQSVARLELEEGWAAAELVNAPEVLSENRFLAARDGMSAELIDPTTERTVPACDVLDQVVAACRPHASELGSADELELVLELSRRSGEVRQRESALHAERLPGLIQALSHEFTQPA
jgi:carboxylate-amine ligase